PAEPRGRGGRGRDRARGINEPAAARGHEGDEPVVKRRLLKLDLTAVQMWQCPRAVVEDRLGVHRRAGFVAAPQIAVGKAVEEENVNHQRHETHEKTYGNETRGASGLPLFFFVCFVFFVVHRLTPTVVAAERRKAGGTARTTS